MYIADLHIHSRYSRATSKDCTPEHLDLWARRKGIGIVGSGDFTHPAWRQELQEKLEPAGNGLYILKKEYRIEADMAADTIQPHFVITGEISSIYKKYDKVRKVHSLILLPGLEEAENISRRLEAIGNIHSDGRPILGLDCRDLLEILLELCPEAVYIPAHIWTPHFSLFGAFSGFDSVEECYGDLSAYIHVMETGLSSDPPMNWRVSALDRYQLISNSDAHSPAKLGREANLLDIELSYEGVRQAIQNGRGLKGTIEFFPEEGKYHYDGHRKCGLCLPPEETKNYGGICPVCGRKLTIGVSNRVEQLSDRPEGYVKENGIPFESLVPLQEVIGASVGHSPTSARVEREYRSLLQKLGPEFMILREIPLEEIRSVSGMLIAEGIGKLRKGEVTRIPGFDGEYGVIRLFSQRELDHIDGQFSLFDALQEEGAADLSEAGTAAETEAASERPEGKLAAEAKKDVQQSAEEFCTANQAKKRMRQTGGVQDHTGTKELSEERLYMYNEDQKRAIESISRVTAVTAGPGTGKTGTMVSHILYLLEIRRVKPSCITAVTFTNQAAGEMRERIRKHMGKSTAFRKLQIGTFHSIARKLLKDQGMEFTLAGDMEIRDLAGKIIKAFSLDMSASRFLTELSNYKIRSGCPGGNAEIHALSSELKQAFQAYQESLKEWNAMDFDDLLLEALRIARKSLRERSRKGDAGAFSYLMVDEFQDINPLQYELIKAWNEGGRELFVIGDPDQAIYGFRGADAGCFGHLTEEFPQTCQIRLQENYRSTSQILSLASEVISRNPGGSRQLRANRPEGSLVRLAQADSEMAEAIFVAKEINRLTGGIGMLEAQEFFTENEGRTRSFGEIAVLYRTHRQAELLESCLKKEGIPYIVAGRDEFLQEPAVRGTISFFQSLVQPENELAGQTALKLLWDLESGSLTESIYQTMAEKYRPFFQKKKPRKVLEEWMEDLHLEKKKGMQKLYRMTSFYQTMQEFLDGLELGVESDLKRCGDNRYSSDAVTLMTLHGSKGLEFPAVIIYGVKKGLIPFETEKLSSDKEEERRLFYVGITRARETLILTTQKEESPFLEEIPHGLIRRETIRQNRQEGAGRQMSLFDLWK